MNPRTARPLLMIGLDALDACLVERWAGAGALPGFRRLYEIAAWGRLDSPTQVMQGSIWPSFVTGLNPARHGLYFMAQLKPGTTELRRMLASDLQAPPFWARAGSIVGPVAVVDVPKLRLVPRPGDTQVVEWGALDHFSRFAAAPAALAADLLRRFGRHPLQAPLWAPWGPLGRQRLARRLQRGIRQKAALTSWLRQREPRLLLSVFGEAHAAGHYLWPRAGADQQAVPEPAADGPLGRVYTTLDRVIASLVADHANTANLILFSGHGMQADTVPSGVLEGLLARMGLIVAPAAATGTNPLGAVARLAGRLPYALRRLANETLIPPALQRRLLHAKGLVGVDPAASQAFVLPSDHQGFIRINLAGREPTGVVPAADYEGLCRRIEDAVLGLRDARTGHPMVERVLRPRTLWSGGAYMDALPDLCVVWHALPRPAEILRSDWGPLPVGRRHPERSGNHRLTGFFFAVGPDIDQSAQGLQADLLDLAPTAMQLLQGALPPGLDGQLLPILQ